MQQLEALSKQLLEEGGGDQDTDSADFLVEDNVQDAHGDPAVEENTGEAEQVDTSGPAEHVESVGAAKRQENAT